MRVINHKKFCCFEYESEVSHSYQLGDILYKDYKGEQEPEIGVVIQTFSDGDFRTDMWGMSYESEVSLATLEQIDLYRPEIIQEIFV